MERPCLAGRRWLRTTPYCYAKPAAREPRQPLNCDRRNFTLSAVAKLDHRRLMSAKLIHLVSRQYGDWPKHCRPATSCRPPFSIRTERCTPAVFRERGGVWTGRDGPGAWNRPGDSGMLSDIFFRLRSLFRGNTVGAELDDELRFHFEQQVQKSIRSVMRARRRGGKLDCQSAESIK